MVVAAAVTVAVVEAVTVVEAVAVVDAVAVVVVAVLSPTADASWPGTLGALLGDATAEHRLQRFVNPCASADSFVTF